MTKRAAIFVTDEHSIAWSASDEPLCYVTPTSETLLADLRAAVRACELTADWIRRELRRDLSTDELIERGMYQITEENADEWLEAAARLRTAIGDPS
jgi:hypothetical protein